MKRIVEDGCQVYLVNTGWTGGGYGKGGQRFSIPVTRAVIHAAQSGELLKQNWDILPGFNVKIPTQVKGVDANLLDPRKTWQDQAAYAQNVKTLIELFQNNFAKFSVPDLIKNAGPK